MRKTGTQLSLHVKAALMMNLLILQCECTSLKFRTHSQAPFITSQVVCKNFTPFREKSTVLMFSSSAAFHSIDRFCFNISFHKGRHLRQGNDDTQVLLLWYFAVLS